MDTMRRRDHPEVWLSENAFLSMVTAAVEAFPEETLGVLIGISELALKRVVVEYAIVYQTAKRARDKVKADPSRKKRTDKFLQQVTRLRVVGDFHSHPEVPVGRIDACWLSEEDKGSMDYGELGFVIAVDRDSRTREWKHLARGSLIGCVFPYSLKITGWLKMERFKIARIHSPFALGLGR